MPAPAPPPARRAARWRRAGSRPYARCACRRPRATGRSPGRVPASGASAVVAAATDRGGEVLAHLGGLTGLPVAANCVSAAITGPGSWRLVRQRWAGSVLEDATLDAEVALLTVAADAVPGASDVV